MQKNDLIIVTIEDMTTEGEGIGKVEGFPFFIKDSIIGDNIQAKIVKMKKTYGYARVEKILTPSINRVQPACDVARQCGGCQLQAMAYSQQLEFKRNKVKNNLKRIGGFQEIEVLPVIGMEHPWRYRNKTQVPFGMDKTGNIVAGFYAGRTHSIIDHEDCLLAPEINRKIIEIIKNYMKQYKIRPYDEKSQQGIVRHVLIRQGYTTGEIMVCLVINRKSLPKTEQLVEQLKQIPGMTSISYNINCENTNVILGETVVPLYGPGYITDFIGTIQYQISPQSFFQVNPIQTEKLYETALKYAGLTGNEIVWDLYCGIGTITLFLAQKAKMVYGVEIVEPAIQDARKNAEINQIQNAEFYVGRAEDILPEKYKKEQIKADVIVIDPPRKGCEQTLLETILQMQPKRIVYVSCDSATLARDLKYLCKEKYQIEKIQPVDMFPEGVHVETVVLLSHKKTDSTISVKVEFGEGEGKVPLDNIAKRAEAYKPKERVTYKMIKEYIEAKYGFKVHTAYIAEVKRSLGLPMYDAPNAVEELKQPRKHPTAEKVEAIKDALKHFLLYEP